MIRKIRLSDSFTCGKMLRFALPSVVMNVFTSLYSVVDGFFVANYAGTTELAAVNLIMPVLNILGTVGYMFGVGGSALVAKTLGAKKPDRANGLFSMIVLASSCVGFLLLAAGFLLMPRITAMLGAEGRLFTDSVLYGRIFILALPAWILVYEFQLFFVAAEKPELGLAVTVCAGLCNVLLDALFIIGFRWGLAGAAAAHNMNVHIHSIGDGATKAWIDAIAEAQSETGNFDMRNALAHLQEVAPEDVKRMGEYNVMAVCGIMWAMRLPAGFAQEVAYVGEEKSYNAYPVKSIIDAGGVVANHSDYPVSPVFSAVQAFCLGVLKKLPSDPDDYIRNIDQAISRHEALKTLTSNVAYMWHEEDRMGTISIGKLANFAVLDKDFMRDDMSEIEKASCLATIVDGEEVYKA